jgi:hypothetical protein
MNFEYKDEKNVVIKTACNNFTFIVFGSLGETGIVAAYISLNYSIVDQDSTTYRYSVIYSTWNISNLYYEIL